MGKPKKQFKEEELTLSKKDQKKVSKLEAQIPYHEGRNNKEEVIKIKQQVADIWETTKQAHLAEMAAGT
jgi:hypothetical protein